MPPNPLHALTLRGRSLLGALAILGAVLSVVAWATASPPGSSPDEDFHLASIWCPTPIDGACETRVGDTGVTQAEVPRLLVESSSCNMFQPAESGACALGVEGTAWTSRLDHGGGYPGTYYDIVHHLVGDDPAATVVTIRIVNGLLAVGLITAVVLLLPLGGRRHVLYAVLPVVAPFPIFLVASVNPSSWAITGVIVAFFGSYGLFQPVSRARRVALAALALVGAFLAAAARADAAAFVGVAIIAVAVMFVRLTWSRRTWIAGGALTALLAATVTAFLASGQSALLLRGFSGGTATETGWTLLFANVRDFLPLLFGFAAVQPTMLNWLDTPVPAITWVTVIALSAAVAWSGLASMRPRKWIALGGVALLYVALPLIFLQVSSAHVGIAFQARYTLPLLFVLMAVVMWSPQDGGAPTIATPQTLALVSGLAVAHSVALHTQIRRFVTGLDVSGFNLNADVEWWHGGPSPMATWAFGTVGFTLLLLALFAVRERSAPAASGV
ncbi:DUF2142 domain-containing protein [Xylanimonas ulmi]|uniref:Putative membrane protein DUF2142 n=1 Tax=Xylanimonas ulmi TaxID=228973 RepID=A0A4Q7LYL8_9MICO|nr:DUF2142 domain-containing protein [Xylanibacterium ulmi]RZS59944.1 putative membrane protein DUF2142 [Xylanibacterium ulmi]